MPRKCCVPGCKGNYSNGPKVSVFLFPKEEEPRNKWIRAIHRDSFIPSNQAVVCELHFRSDEIERTTSMHDPRTGKLVSAPLYKPRLKRDAVPSQLPGCPEYLSRPSTSRDSPEHRRERLENYYLYQSINESLKSHEEHMKSISVHSLEELEAKIKNCEISNEWVIYKQESNMCFVLLQKEPYPKVKSYVLINDVLSLSFYIEDCEVKNVGGEKLPIIVKDTNQFTTLLKEIYIASVQSEDESVRSKIEIVKNLLQSMTAQMPEKTDALDFLIEQVSVLNCKAKMRRYSWKSLVFWSLIHLISPHCYRYLRSTSVLTIPCPVSLSRINSSFSTNPLVEQESSNFLSYISRKVEFLKDDDKKVVLLMDEIHLKPQLDYKGGNIVGHAGNADCATSAYVFMIRSLGSVYLDVVHILPVKTMKAENLHNIIKKIIIKLESIGISVFSVVSDNNAINRKSMSYFSSPPEVKTRYDHPNNLNAKGRPLFFIVDSVHILKCIRNNWLKSQIIFSDFDDDVNGGVASLQALRTLHVLEKDNLVKCGRSLTLKTLYPSSLERQNVKLAINIFNYGTIAALRELGPKKNIENWEGTANFIQLICTWWDIVNVKSVLKGQRLRNRFQEPVTLNSMHIMEFMEKFAIWVKNNVTGLSTETRLSIVNTTSGLMDLALYWLDNSKKGYFLTGKVQTDDLEDRFGKYRQMSGGNYHISVRQMFETESKLRAQSYLSLILRSEKVGNVTITYDDILKSALTHVGDVAEFPKDLDVIVTDEEMEEIDELIIPVVFYISGYCSFKIIQEFRCEYCKRFVTASDDERDDTRNSLIYQTDRGGLSYPSNDVVECVLRCLAVTQKILDEKEELFLAQNKQREILNKICVDNLMCVEIFSSYNCTRGHNADSIIKSIVKTTINILLNNYTKKINDHVKKIYYQYEEIQEFLKCQLGHIS